MKFRKKPVVIEAIKNTGPYSYDEMREAWGEAWEHAADWLNTSGLQIRTLEGTHHADIGDWVIRGVKGEFYPCKPDIFEMTYEPALHSKPPRQYGQPGEECDHCASIITAAQAVVADHDLRCEDSNRTLERLEEALLSPKETK